jgi:AcrR family transcriptional regulator
MTESPRPRGNKRERTREKLVAATLEVLAERGFAGASLEAIARRAGVTRGSIYSNFADREQLLMAAISTRGMSLDRDFSEPMPLKDQLRRFAEALWGQLPIAAGGGNLIIEYQIYAMGQPDLRPKLAAAYEGMFEKMAAPLAVQYADELAIPAHTLALAIQALAMGLVWQFMLTPGEVRREAVLAAFDALAAGATR